MFEAEAVLLFKMFELLARTRLPFAMGKFIPADVEATWAEAAAAVNSSNALNVSMLSFNMAMIGLLFIGSLPGLALERKKLSNFFFNQHYKFIQMILWHNFWLQF